MAWVKEQMLRSASSEMEEEEAACLVSHCGIHSQVGWKAVAGTTDGGGCEKGHSPSSSVTISNGVTVAHSGDCERVLQRSSHMRDRHLPRNVSETPKDTYHLSA